MSRHFRDRNSIYPDPSQLKFISTLPDDQYLSGVTSSFGKLIPWRYRYEVRKNSSNEVLIVSRIHFKGATQAQFDALSSGLKFAASVWNDNAPRSFVSFPFRFVFLATKDEKIADYSVKLVAGTNGPFFSRWDPEWDYATIAHEMGHVMGLSDEYSEVMRNNNRCDHASIMCGHSGSPQIYHYYHILRRLYRYR